ncbi:unnamed protein product [Closterium sp. NIES-54]
MKRMSVMPSTWATLNEDSLTSYILRDKAMQEAERSMELLQQMNYAAPAKQGGQSGQRGQSGGCGSSGGRLTKDADKQKSAKEGGLGGGGRRWECWICHSPDHLSFECRDRSDSDDDDTKGGRGRLAGRHPRRKSKPRNERQSIKTSTSAKDAESSSGGKGRGDQEGSCSLVGVVKPTVSLAPEASEDFQAVAATMQANPAVVLLDIGCSHHLMGTKDTFVDLGPSCDFKHVHGLNGVLQDVQGRGTVALQGATEKQVLIPNVLYVPGVTRLCVLYGRVLCTDLRPCSAKLTTPTAEVVALRAIVSVTKSTLARWHAKLAHVGADTITSLAKHEAATGLDIKPSAGTDSPCVSCVDGKLARHTFPDKGSDVEDALAVVRIDLCGLFRVAAKDGSLYFVLLKERKTRYVWVMPVAKKSDVLREFAQWVVFTDFVDGKGIVHDLTCPYTTQQNGMAEREMRMVVESVRMMLLHMSVQHHWWHLALRQAVWVRNCLERSTLAPGTTLYQLLTRKKPDLSLAQVWGCMAQFLVPEKQCSGKLKPKARWGLHLGVSEESRAGSSSTSPTTRSPRRTWCSTKRCRWSRPAWADIGVGQRRLWRWPRALPVYDADYDETYAPVSSYVTLRIFLSIVAVFDLILMQLDMKNAFLQSKLHRVLYMYQPDYFNDGIDRVCKLLKSLYGLKKSPLLWYRALDSVLLGAGWKKSQVDTALYFKVGGDGVACWVLVYVDDLLAASSSTTMLKELLEAAFELHEISHVEKLL